MNFIIGTISVEASVNSGGEGDHSPFLSKHDEFVVDERCDRFLMTSYLKRKK